MADTQGGSCHCGAVRYQIEGSPDDVMECNCSHCQRKGYLLWFVPRAAVRFSAGEAALKRYTFNRHVIEHLFCPTCGCAPLGFGKGGDGTETAAVNVRCLDDASLVQRLPRRQVDGRSF